MVCTMITQKSKIFKMTLKKILNELLVSNNFKSLKIYNGLVYKKKVKKLLVLTVHFVIYTMNT